MFVKIEPADFFMFRVQLIFDLENADSEDQQVREYLAEHELEPKHRATGQLDERQCEFLMFGGCYLGRHLDEISQIQRRAVEVELLTAAIEGHLDGEDAGFAGLPDGLRSDTVEKLVQEFNQETSFQTLDNGELSVALEGEQVREAARKLIGTSEVYPTA